MRPQHEGQRLGYHGKRKVTFERSRKTAQEKHRPTLQRTNTREAAHRKYSSTTRKVNAGQENTNMALTWKGRVTTVKGKVMNKRKCAAPKFSTLAADARRGERLIMFSWEVQAAHARALHPCACLAWRERHQHHCQCTALVSRSWCPALLIVGTWRCIIMVAWRSYLHGNVNDPVDVRDHGLLCSLHCEELVTGTQLGHPPQRQHCLVDGLHRGVVSVATGMSTALMAHCACGANTVL